MSTLSPPRDRFWRWAPPLVLVILWASLMHPLTRGAPMSHDHPTHLFKAWHLWNEMLSGFRVTGWSHFWGAGFPAGEVLPPGSELWVVLFRALTLGLVPWLEVYSLAFAAAFGFFCFATFVFTRRFFGSGAAFVATLLSMLDPGAWAQGGWFWTVKMGVWPVTLSMAFLMLAIVKWEDCVGRSRLRDVALGGLWLGASLVTHPLALLALALTAPLFCFDCLVRAERISPQKITRIVPSILLGIGLAGFSLFPLLARVRETLDLGIVGKPLDEVVARILNMDVFDGVWRPISVFAIIGAIAAIRARKRGAFLFAWIAAACLLLSSDFLIMEIHAERFWPNLVKIEATRMLFLAKIFWYPLAGLAAVELWRFAPAPNAQLPWLLRGGRWVALLGILAVMAPSAKRFFHGTYFQKPIQTTRTTGHYADMKRFFDWSKKERASTKEPYRIAYKLGWHDHLSTLAPVYNDTWALKVGYTPSQNFKYMPMTFEPEVLEALMVKFVLTPEKLRSPLFTHVKAFGGLNLYRFSRYRSEPFQLSGPGKAELLELSPEKIRIRVDETSPDSSLKIFVAHHDRWQASLDGTTIPLHRASIAEPRYAIVSQISVPRGGEVVLRYVQKPVDRIGMLSSLLAFPLFFLTSFGVRRFRRGNSMRLALRAPRRAELLWHSAVLILVLVVLSIALISGRASTRTQFLPPESLFRASQPPALALDGVPCQLTAPQKYQCGPHQVTAGFAFGTYGNHLCMSTPSRHALSIKITKPLGKYLDIEYSPHGTVGRIEVKKGSRRFANLSTRPPEEGVQYLRFETKTFAQEKEGEIELTIRNAPLRCFDVRTSNE